MEDKLVMFRLVDEKKALENKRAKLIEEYNKLVFEEGPELILINAEIAENSKELERVRKAIVEIKSRNSIFQVQDWGREYRNGGK